MVAMFQAGPSPGFSSREGHIFKMQCWMYVATGGPKVKWGGTDFKWGGQAPLPPPLATAVVPGEVVHTKHSVH